MRAAVLAGLALFPLVACIALPAGAELPGGRGVLLPVQDRVGEAQVVQLTESLFRQELLARGDLAEPDTVRSVLRSMRVRDVSNEPPDRLAAVADRLGVEWFFLATLHEARGGRQPVREQRSQSSLEFENNAATPQVVISARILRRDSEQVWWAGFDGASGRDGEKVFGLGEVAVLDELLQNTVTGLVERAAEPQRTRGRLRLRPRRDGYVRPANGPIPPQTVAVVPMDSVATLEPGASAEVATAALFAVLDEFGFRTLVPGFVRAVREDAAQLQPGGVSRPEWEALAKNGGARWVATGTVETYRRGHGSVPDPRVAVSVRFLDTSDGKIGWSSGRELSGHDTARVFDRGRIYSTGDLTYEMMRSLLGEL